MTLTYNQTGVTYDSSLYTYDGAGYQPTPFPVAGIYISFDDGPYTANPNWVEVSTYVRGFTTHRGRSSDFDQFDTGTAQLILDNRDRRFDPFYTSGPYYGKLLPRRPIRIVGQIGGTLYEVFRGFVAGWPVTWSEYGRDSTVTIQCFDALGLMAGETVPTDWLTTYTSSLNPYLYFTGSGSSGLAYLVSYDAKWGFFNDSGGTLPNFFETPSLLEGVQGTAKYCPLYSTYMPRATTARADFSLSGYVQFSSPSQVLTFVGSVTGTYGDTTAGLYFYYDNDSPFVKDTLYIRQTHAAAGSGKYFRAAITTSTAQGFHFVMNYTGGTDTPTLYINGTQVTLTLIGTDPSSGLRGFDGISNLNCALSQFALHSRLLTATEISTMAGYASARVQETTSARMDRLIGQTEWPPSLTAFTASPAASVSAIGSGSAVVPELQLVADSEGGELYVSKAGVLTMTNRTDVFNATRSATVQATITDTGSGVRYGGDLEIRYDADNLKNDITVNLADDSEVNLFNQVTIDEYGAASTTIETLLSDVGSALQLAAMELGVEGVLVPQISPIDVSPNTAAADWQAILGLELLDRVNFKRTPTVGNQFSRDALVNAIDHQVEPGVWRTQLTLSMRYTSPLKLDDPVLGKLDFNYLG